MRREGEPNREQLREFTLDVSDGWDTDSKKDLIVEKLSQLGFLTDEYAFRGVDQMDIKGVKSGSEVGDIIYASTHEQIQENEDSRFGGLKNAAYFAMNDIDGALAIYQKSKLEDIDGSVKYKLQDGALVSIIHIKGAHD